MSVAWSCDSNLCIDGTDSFINSSLSFWFEAKPPADGKIILTCFSLQSLLSSVTMRTVLHVVTVGYHADVRIATKSAIVHQKVVRNGRKSNAYSTILGRTGVNLLTVWVIFGITTLTKFDR